MKLKKKNLIARIKLSNIASRKNNTGITLIALIVTIIVLLILAGVTISIVLGNNGVLTQASKAVLKTNIAQVKERLEMDVSSWITEKYTGGNKTLKESLEEGGYRVTDNGDKTYTVVGKGDNNTEYTFKVTEDGKVTEEGPNSNVSTAKLSDIVSVGDYVSYTPDSASEYLISSAYSGYSSEQNISQENLNWRVLDIKNGQVRLISETPTSNSVLFNVYQGYNNAVYLLDDLCSTLYSKTGIGTAKNLKIEDIEDHIKNFDETLIKTWTSSYGSTFNPSYKYYPSILAQEKNQIVNGISGSTYGLSEQTSLISQSSTQQVSSWTVKGTYWSRSMIETDFTDNIYQKLLIKKEDGINNQDSYLLSSRCVDVAYNVANFYVRSVQNGNVTGVYSCNSSNYTSSIGGKYRPVITLQSDILVNTNNAKDGTTQAKAWELK